jgi:hypothetical protein
MFVYNQTPLRLSTEIFCVPPGNAAYLHPTGCIPLYTSPFPGVGVHVANLTRAEHSVNLGPAPVEDGTWGMIKALYGSGRRDGARRGPAPTRRTDRPALVGGSVRLRPPELVIRSRRIPWPTQAAHLPGLRLEVWH